MKLGILSLVLITSILSGCGSITRIDHVPLKKESARDLVVFFDGTANDESSHTNIAKLHNLVTLQDRSDISATYIKGVGTGAKLIGMGMGFGIGHDVREAYSYLIENYDPKYDRISIFGFSRGAYASRILAALLYVAGIPEAKALTAQELEKLVDDIYGAYKGIGNIDARRRRVSSIIDKEWDGKHDYKSAPVNVRFLGLWDSVEALGWPDLEENINEPNGNYADQLCNIENVAHALSIDDNRARIFTPLLLTRQHLLKKGCDDNSVFNPENLEEVWFSGAHSDVGGGYKDTEISGVSLNWMLARLKHSGLDLVPASTNVYANHLGLTHNPEGGIFGLIYRDRNRNIPCYTEVLSSPPEECIKDRHDGLYREESTAASSILKVHQSVLDRLCVKPPEAHESFWFREKKYENCLACDSDGHGYVKNDKNCMAKIKVAENVNDHYHHRAATRQDNLCDSRACPEAAGQPYTYSKACNLSHENAAVRATQGLKKVELGVTGELEDIVVYADVKSDRTGVYLSKNVVYKVSISEVRDWVDCTIVGGTPENGRDTLNFENSVAGSFLGLIVKPIAYAPFSGYMKLLGAVSGQQIDLGKMALNGTEFSPKQDGELILRVNEPRFMDVVYQNNSGVLKLKISAVRES